MGGRAKEREREGGGGVGRPLDGQVLPLLKGLGAEEDPDAGRLGEEPVVLGGADRVLLEVELLQGLAVDDRLHLDVWNKNEREVTVTSRGEVTVTSRGEVTL